MKKTLLKTLLAAAAVLAMSVSVQAAGIRDGIYAGLKGAQPKIDVSSFHVSPQTAMDEYFKVVNDNPDLFYVDYHVDCKYDTKTGDCMELICSYNTKDVKGERAKFDAAVNAIVAEAKTKSTKYEQIKAVHDYMVANYSFDAAGTTSFAMATAKKGNCTAYAGVFKAAMDKLGIANKVARSVDMCHEWNVVQLDGKWYHVDVTWDDPIGGSGIIYSNFLKSDKLVTIGGHFNWKIDGDIKCTDTAYDTLS